MPARERADLFYGKSGSYGSLGLLTAVKISLLPSTDYVNLTYFPCNSPTKVINLIKELSSKQYDYLDGIIFNKNSAVVMAGKRTNSKLAKIRTFSCRTDPWLEHYAYSIAHGEKVHEDTIPIFDYLFRYDRGAYWMGDYFLKYVTFGYNFIGRAIFDSILHAHEMYRALHLGNMSQLFFAQDFYIPINEASQFVKHIGDRGIFPIWLCPMKSTQTPQKLSPSYSKSKLLLNVGAYGRSKQYAGDFHLFNRIAEKKAAALGGRKMLYAHAYYPEKEFWKIYNKSWYQKLRQKYSANKFPNVFETTHVSERYDTHVLRGALKFFWTYFTKKDAFS